MSGSSGSGSWGGGGAAPPATPPCVLSIEGLSTRFRGDSGVTTAVRDLTLSIAPGRTLGLVGESGSGKSVTSLSVMRLLPEVGVELSGRVSFLGRDLLAASDAALRDLRGRDLAMIFQEPMTSLNPVFPVGEQVAESVRRHEGLPARAAMARAESLFGEVGIPDPAASLRKYPHQMSGGQKQRVMIAMALACNPRLLIADEPTTALDVTIQAQILELLRKLRDQRGMAMLFITHDLGVIAEIADDVAVMYRGALVEQGPVLEVFTAPKHPYTRGLLACRPRPDAGWRRLPTVADFMETRAHDDGTVEIVACDPDPARLEALRGPATSAVRADAPPLLEVRDLHVHFPVAGGGLAGWFGRGAGVFRAVDGVSLDVRPGETLGLVGESGCGKTTTGRAIVRLVEPTSGEVRFLGQDVRALRGEALRRMRRHVQVVFQDPFASLNPRLTVEATLCEPMEVHGIGAGGSERRDRAVALLREVGLQPEHLGRYPHEFSGGQRQRICIARALVVDPKLVICDESVSALDVSVQAQVLNLLKDLQESRGLAYVFISHDLGVVAFMSDRIAVMRQGRIVEKGPAAEVYGAPREAYTRNLVAAIPRDDVAHIEALQAARARAAAAREAGTA
ncbi:MAG: Glutathione import ATP-binding protein GsiA [Pseudomonadota bacterium]